MENINVTLEAAMIAETVMLAVAVALMVGISRKLRDIKIRQERTFKLATMIEEKVSHLVSVTNDEHDNFMDGFEHGKAQGLAEGKVEVMVELEEERENARKIWLQNQQKMTDAIFDVVCDDKKKKK